MVSLPGGRDTTRADGFVAGRGHPGCAVRQELSRCGGELCPPSGGHHRTDAPLPRRRGSRCGSMGHQAASQDAAAASGEIRSGTAATASVRFAAAEMIHIDPVARQIRCCRTGVGRVLTAGVAGWWSGTSTSRPTATAMTTTGQQDRPPPADVPAPRPSDAAVAAAVSPRGEQLLQFGPAGGGDRVDLAATLPAGPGPSPRTEAARGRAGRDPARRTTPSPLRRSRHPISGASARLSGSACRPGHLVVQSRSPQCPDPVDRVRSARRLSAARCRNGRIAGGRS